MMTPYHAFLLRLWRVSEVEPAIWHASLENPHTREVRGFDNLDPLLDYLRELTRETDGAHSSAVEARKPLPGRPVE
jgi:hypothetical protein